MDAELRAYPDGRFTGLETRFNQIDERFGQIDRRFTQIDERFGHIERRFVEVSERIEKTETTLLTEFWKWARTSDMRMRQTMSDTAHFGERLMAVEDRITSLERKASGQ